MSDEEKVFTGYAWCLILYYERYFKYCKSDEDYVDVKQARDWIIEKNEQFAGLTTSDPQKVNLLLNEKIKLISKICKCKAKDRDKNIDRYIDKLSKLDEDLSYSLSENHEKIESILNIQTTAVINSIKNRSRMYFAECRKNDKVVKESAELLYKNLYLGEW